MSLITDTIAHCLQRDITFALFRRQGQVELWVSEQPQLEKIAWHDLDRHRELFLVAPFIPHPAYCHALVPLAKLPLDGQHDLLPLTKARSAASSAGMPLLTHWPREAYKQAVSEAITAIQEGQLTKVVLSRTQEQPVDRYMIPGLFENALKELPEAYVCLLHCPEFGTWIGASPERSISAKGQRVQVDSIAGTLPLQAAPEDPDQWGSKEKEEQRLVTQALLNTFLEHGAQAVRVVGPEVLKAAHVAHLHTIVSGELAPKGSLAALLKDLHPTPAVCGTPRTKAMTTILKHEPHERSLYGGFWGTWRDHNNTDLHVNIRCMRLLGDRGVIYTGGGITAGSDPEKEWAETEHKSLTWRRPLEAMRMGIS